MSFSGTVSTSSEMGSFSQARLGGQQVPRNCLSPVKAKHRWRQLSFFMGWLRQAAQKVTQAES